MADVLPFLGELLGIGLLLAAAAIAFALRYLPRTRPARKAVPAPAA